MSTRYRERNNSIITTQKIFKQVSKKSKEATSGKALQDALIFARSIIGTIREPLLVLDSNLRVISANKSYYKKFNEKRKNTEDKFIYNLTDSIWDIPELKDLLEKVVPQRTFFEGFEIKVENKKFGQRTFLLNARQLDDLLEYKKLILLAIEDITESKKLENLTKKKLGFLLDSTNDIFIFLNAELELIEANKLFLNKIKKWYGLQKKDVIGKKITGIITDFKKLKSYKKINKVLEKGKTLNWNETLNDSRNIKIFVTIQG
jgi:PAS domain-containing protein